VKDHLKTRLGLKHPLIVAPMAGGPSSVELVAESSNAGALGSVGAAYMGAAAIKTFVEQVRTKTSKPIAINLFIPQNAPPVSSKELARAVSATQKYLEELGLTAPDLQPPYEENFEEQFEQILELKPAVLSFVFGILERGKVHEAQNRGIIVIGTATTPEEARTLESTGVDAITLQGIEAGGHRGIFDADAKDTEIGIQALLKQCVSKIKIPLIAAGGIMNRKDIEQALSLGASAVQMGTAFLACTEAGTSAPYRAALLAHEERHTKTTRVFSGRLARGLINRFMTEMEKIGPEALLPFPAQNQFTRDLRNASVKLGHPDFLSLWSGTGKGSLWQGPCKELIDSLFAV
jgi:nitronate monooxygenase